MQYHAIITLQPTIRLTYECYTSLHMLRAPRSPLRYFKAPAKFQGGCSQEYCSSLKNIGGTYTVLATRHCVRSFWEEAALESLGALGALTTMHKTAPWTGPSTQQDSDSTLAPLTDTQNTAPYLKYSKDLKCKSGKHTNCYKRLKRSKTKSHKILRTSENLWPPQFFFSSAPCISLVPVGMQLAPNLLLLNRLILDRLHRSQ